MKLFLLLRPSFLRVYQPSGTASLAMEDVFLLVLLDAPVTSQLARRLFCPTGFFIKDAEVLDERDQISGIVYTG